MGFYRVKNIGCFHRPVRKSLEIIIYVVMLLGLAYTLVGVDMYSLIIFISGLEILIYVVALLNSWYHVIILIILLEFLRVKIFVISSLVLIIQIRGLFLFFFVVMIVCEASIGISLIVRVTRGRGDEVIEI